MDLTKVDETNGGEVLNRVKDLHWSQHLAAGSLVAGAVLLLLGKRREALIVAAAGASTTLLDRPEVAQQLWSQVPTHIRNGQDFLVRAESFIEKLGEQATRLRETFTRQAQS